MKNFANKKSLNATIDDQQFDLQFQVFQEEASRIKYLLGLFSTTAKQPGESDYQVVLDEVVVFSGKLVLSDLIAGMTSRLLNTCQIFRISHDLTKEQSSKLSELTGDL